MSNDIKLRPYQQGGINSIKQLILSGKKRIVLCSPTGSGKTVIFSAIASGAAAKGKRVIILTDRRELLSQSQAAVRGSARVVMVESFYRKLRSGEEKLDMDLLIIDEAHRGNFKKILDITPKNVIVIGATATPLYATKSRLMRHDYDSIVEACSIGSLLDSGYLANPVTYAPAARRDLLEIKNGEYTEASQRRAIYGNLIEKFLSVLNGGFFGGSNGRTICYCVNVAHSLETVALFRSSGILAEHIDGSTHPDRRDFLFRQFKQGEFQVLCNVGVATTGYDDPSLSGVIINRVTKSLTEWLQMCGRGGRRIIDKNQFFILDMGLNYTELGLWEQERDWMGLFHESKQKTPKTGGIPPTKVCPSCEALISASATSCNFCNYQYPVVKRELRADGVVIVGSDTQKVDTAVKEYISGRLTSEQALKLFISPHDRKLFCKKTNLNFK